MEYILNISIDQLPYIWGYFIVRTPTVHTQIWGIHKIKLVPPTGDTSFSQYRIYWKIMLDHMLLYMLLFWSWKIFWRHQDIEFIFINTNVHSLCLLWHAQWFKIIMLINCSSGIKTKNNKWNKYNLMNIHKSNIYFENWI